MKSLGVIKILDPFNLQLGFMESAIACPVDYEVLVRVQCATVTDADFRASWQDVQKKRKGMVIGLEICGSVAEFGDKCSRRFSIGDQVIGLVDEGGCAEFVLVDERLLLKAIPSIPPSRLCCIPASYLNAIHLCFFVNKIKPNDLVLVHAAGSSVGQAIIQLLSNQNTTVVCTIRNEEKRSLCYEFGAKHVLNVSQYDTTNEWMKVLSKKYPKGFDIILDSIGEYYWTANITLLKPFGKLSIYDNLGDYIIMTRAIAQAATTHTTSSPGGDTLSVTDLLAKQITIQTTSFFQQSIEYKQSVIEYFETHCTSNLQAGQQVLCPPTESLINFSTVPTFDIRVTKPLFVLVDSTYSIDDCKEGVQKVIRKEQIGKVVILISNAETAIDELTKELTNITMKHGLRK